MFEFVPATLVVLNTRRLGQLKKRLNRLHPGIVDAMWSQQSLVKRFETQLDMLGTMRDRAFLFHVATVTPNQIPLVLLGDDEVAQMVRRLHGSLSGRFNRFLAQLTGKDTY